ncbi:unnamed protein product [Symbiodinium natans]|uniref:C3H1-type domain-containing protein n=1 Tax=Symbiodinium natans TaxID=878477 RepID=A0A812V5N2_9DINO|nr:unnamed protein product [Symbiodinium natans]
MELVYSKTFVSFQEVPLRAPRTKSMPNLFKTDLDVQDAKALEANLEQKIKDLARRVGGWNDGEVGDRLNASAGSNAGADPRPATELWLQVDNHQQVSHDQHKWRVPVEEAPTEDGAGLDIPPPAADLRAQVANHQQASHDEDEWGMPVEDSRLQEAPTEDDAGLDIPPPAADLRGAQVPEDAAQAPPAGVVVLPVAPRRRIFNIGSIAHPQVCRRPCMFFLAGQCRNGVDCGFCHLPHNYRPIVPDQFQRSCMRKASLAELTVVVLEHLEVKLAASGYIRLGTLLLEVLRGSVVNYRTRVLRANETECLKMLFRRMTIGGLVQVILNKAPEGAFAERLEQELLHLRMRVTYG